MRPLRFLSLVLLLVTTFAALALEVPPPPKRWVTDSAGVLSLTDVATLDTKLENFEQTSGAQFLIYTFKSIEGESIEDFTQRCVTAWKVGQAKYDNGLVLFVFVAERKVRVEVGYGLEGSVTDAFSSRVIREQIAPFFQKGDYGAGLTAGADALMNKIRTGEEPVAPLNPRGAQGPQGGVEEERPEFGVIVFLVIVFIFFVLPMLSRRRRGGGGCGGPGCLLPFLFSGGGSGITFGGGGGGFSGGGFGGGGGGGFSGGGGGFGGGGATGGW